MKSFGRIVLYTFLSVGALSRAHADILAYHPSSTLRLGGTFDPIDLTDVKPPCIVHDGEVPVDGMGETAVSPKMTFFIRQITDFREFYSYMSLSASVSGHYKAFSAGGSFSQEEENFSSSDSFSWVMGVSALYGRYRVENPRLTADAQRLAERGELIQFARRCGTQLVTQTSRGINAAVVFTIKNMTERNRSSLTASFNASFGGGLWGVDAGADFEKQVRSLIETGQITLDIRTIGGPGAAELASIIKDLDKANIGKVRDALSRYVAKQGPEGSVPIEFQSGSLSAFVPALGDPDRTAYLVTIGELFVAHQENAYMLRKYRQFLQSSEDFNPTDPALEQAVKNIVLFQSRLGEIQRAAIACRSVMESVQEKRLASRYRNGRREPVVDSDVSRRAERLLAERMRYMNEISKSASVSPDKTMLSSAKMASVLQSLPKEFVPENKQDLEECSIDPRWFEFSGFPQLPSFPFTYDAWDNPLEQSPDHYVYTKVSGSNVEAARLVDGANNVLRLLKRDSDSGPFSGMIEISGLGSDRLPVRLSVTMRSQNVYTVQIVPAP